MESRVTDILTNVRYFRVTRIEHNGYDWAHWTKWFDSVGIRSWVETNQRGDSWVVREGVDAFDTEMAA